MILGMTDETEMSASDVIAAELTKGVAEQSIREEGFLSEWIERFVPIYRQMDQAWINHSKDLNRLGQDLVMSFESMTNGTKSLDAKAIVYRLMLRALSSYQAAIILAERGMTKESGQLSRSVYECGFWVGYFQTDKASACEAIIEDEAASQYSYLKIYRKHIVKKYGKKSAEVREVDRNMAKKGKGKRMNIDQLVDLSNLPDFYLHHKSLSSSAAHTSLSSLHSYIDIGDQKQFIGHRFGPDQQGISESLANACNSMQLTICAFSMFIGTTKFDEKIREMLDRYGNLRMEMF